MSDDSANHLSHRQQYFDDMYLSDPDPWGFDSRWYEARKYAVTLASLPRQRYRHAIEPGCSNGAFTELLAERCDHVTAFDFIDEVVVRARARFVTQPNVSVHRARFPEFWPTGGGDLVVWSEVAYYLTDEGMRMAIDGLGRWLEPGGHLIAVHYTGDTDYPHSAQEVHAMIHDVPFLAPIVRHTDSGFDLMVWERTSRASGVASTRTHQREPRPQ